MKLLLRSKLFLVLKVKWLDYWDCYTGGPAHDVPSIGEKNILGR